jgi:hypothetical protein
VGAFVLLAFIAAPWAMISYYLRFLLIALYALALFASFRQLGSERHSLARISKPALAAQSLALAFLLLLDVVIIRAFFFPPSVVEVQFPLAKGVFYVVPNVLHPSGTKGRQERYALDIVKLNPAGNRASGFYPRSLSSYAIHGESVYSPCAGVVVEANDGREDNPIGDLGHSPSNQVIIRCGVVNVTLGHLLNGSLKVRDGESISEGQLLAEVGNSGHSSEPHLHIDAVRDTPAGPATGAEPVALSFGGKIPTLNSVISR